MSARQETANEQSAQSPRAVSRAALIYSMAAAVALIGLADATYLTIEHYTGQNVRCSITSGCGEVLGSSYATIKGMPLAALGAAAYFAAFSLALLAAFGYGIARTLIAPLVALMLVTSLWLLYLQAFVLHAFCQYCLLSAAVTCSLVGIVAAEKYMRARAARPNSKSISEK